MRASTVLWIAVLAVVVGTASALARRPEGAAVPSSLPAEMAATAKAFVASLDEGGRAKAVYALESEERLNWHYVPRERNGLPLKEMTQAQRIAAHALLKSALSSRGYLKATSIFYLEGILKALEGGSPVRDPERYFFTIFGTPHPDSAWGWRVEGHHLSLNYTSAAGEVSVTPAFFGANPAEVRSGPFAGLRVLAGEEEAGRALMAALDAAQRAKALLPVEAPGDIVTAADREVRLAVFEGLPAAEMTPAQRALLLQLVEEYALNVPEELGRQRIARIRAAGVEQLYFAWAGSLERGKPHYYRVHGPTVLFEYDNTQNDANHVHTVWRDLEDDFGADLLRRHYETSDHHH